jgi:dTDP-4-dehydrorhamnose reductase
MNILVVGASGMAGHIIATFLTEEGFEISTLAAHKQLSQQTSLLDATNFHELDKFLSDKPYDAIINCAALLVKASNEHKDRAVLLNTWLPLYLEHRYARTPTKIIHISSDGVFSDKQASYTEDSACDADDFYGQTKALGEIRSNKDLSLRTSIIGPELHSPGQSLFDWFFRQKDEITGYSEVFWQGVSTITLAKGIKACLEQKLTGIYHFIPEKSISKFDLLQLCKDTFGRNNLVIIPDGRQHFNRALLNTRHDLDFVIPGYPSMVQEIRQWIESHTDLYPQYMQQET